ncbi:MAG: hypothetical protein ACM3ZT_04750 [Bacillota bacterium]
MKIHAWLKGAAASAVTLLVLAPLTARADVTIGRFTHFGGVLGMGANDTTSTEYLQGEKKRDESNTKFTGSVLGALQHFSSGDKGSNHVSIMRVDENKLYTLDVDKKTYSEHPLYQPPEPGKGGENGTEENKQDKDTKITKNEFTVKDTGKTQKINGFDTHEYVLTWDLETENTKTGATSKSLMTTDMWNSTDARFSKVRDEELAFSKAYLKLMHLPSNPDELKQFGFTTASIRVNGEDAQKFFEKLRTIKGYPISMDVTWEASGTGDNGTGSNSSQPQAQQNPVAALGSLFGSKKDDSQKQTQGTPGMTTVFSSHTELKSLDTGSLDKALFEVPGDYKTD